MRRILIVLAGLLSPGLALANEPRMDAPTGSLIADAMALDEIGGRQEAEGMPAIPAPGSAASAVEAARRMTDGKARRLLERAGSVGGEDGEDEE